MPLLHDFVSRARSIVAQMYNPTEERNRTGQWGGATPEHGGGAVPGGGGQLANAPVGNTPTAPVASPTGSTSLSGPYSGYGPLSHTNPGAKGAKGKGVRGTRGSGKHGSHVGGRKKSTGLHSRVKAVRAKKSGHLKSFKATHHVKSTRTKTGLHRRVARVRANRAHAAHHFKLMGIHSRGHAGHKSFGVGKLPSSRSLSHGRNASFSKPLRPPIAPGTTRFHGMAKKSGAATRGAGGGGRKKH